MGGLRCSYVSIRNTYLLDFKILPLVQFFARMWHVAILVTSGLYRAIYWPPSAASTIYLLPPLLFSSLTSRAVLFSLFALFSFSLPFSLSFSLFPSSFASFFLCRFFSFRLALFFLSQPSLTIELNQRWNATSTWTSISQTFRLDIFQYRQLSDYKLAALWII